MDGLEWFSRSHSLPGSRAPTAHTKTSPRSARVCPGRPLEKPFLSVDVYLPRKLVMALNGSVQELG